MARKFKIVGDRPVVGHQPGDFLSEEDLAGVNVDALITGGHIQPVAPKKATEKEESE